MGLNGWIKEHPVITTLVGLASLVVAVLGVARDAVDWRVDAKAPGIAASSSAPAAVPPVVDPQYGKADPLDAAGIGDCVRPSAGDPDVMEISPCGAGSLTVLARFPLRPGTSDPDAADRYADQKCHGLKNYTDYTWSDGTGADGVENPFVLCLKQN